MPIRVDAYISEGVAKGVLAREGHVRDALEQAGVLPLAGVQWQAFDSTARPAADMSIPSDDVLIVICDDDPSVPVHAQWHGIRLEVGPYTLEGEMPTLPGFDPGRALTRPSGEFIQLRDVSIGLRSDSRSRGAAHAGRSQRARQPLHGRERRVRPHARVLLPGRRDGPAGGRGDRGALT